MSMAIENFKMLIYSIIKHNKAAWDTDVGSQRGSLTRSCTWFYGSGTYTVIQNYYECQHLILGSLFVTRWTHSSSSPMYWGRFGAFPRIPDGSWESSGRRGALFPSSCLSEGWAACSLHLAPHSGSVCCAMCPRWSPVWSIILLLI